MGSEMCIRDSYRHVLDRGLARLGETHLDTLRSLHNMGVLVSERGSIAEVEALMARMVAAKRAAQLLGNNPPSTLESVGVLARVLARTLACQQLDGLERAHGRAHTLTLGARELVAGMALGLGQLDEAERLIRAAIATREACAGAPGRSNFSPRSPLTPDAAGPADGSHARALNGFPLAGSPSAGKAPPAPPSTERMSSCGSPRAASSAPPTTASPASPAPPTSELSVVSARAMLVAVLVRKGELSEADLLARRVVATMAAAAALGESAEGENVADVLDGLALVLLTRGDAAALREAKPLATRAVELLCGALGERRRRTELARGNLGLVQMALPTTVRAGEALVSEAHAALIGVHGLARSHVAIAQLESALDALRAAAPTPRPP